MTSTNMQPKRWTLALLGALCLITPFSVDMYLPAFSAIAHEFHTATAQISLSLSTYFVGFGLGQLGYGPLLDRFGRKRPVYVGVCIYIAASIACACAHSLHMLAALRFLQAAGGCVAEVAALALVKDLFPAEESAKILSRLFLMIGISPLLAPTTGSLLIGTLGWRAIFLVLAAVAAAILAGAVLYLPAGREPDKTVDLRPAPILAGFWAILRQPQFFTCTMAGGLSFAGVLGFVSGSPALLMDGYHLTTRIFGFLFAALVMGLIGGSQVNVVLLRRFTSAQILLAALAVQAATGALFYLGTSMHLLGLRSTLALLFIFLSSIGLTNPNSAALALAPFEEQAGRASALLGFLQIGIGALISLAIGTLGGDSLIMLLAVSSALALLVTLAGRGLVSKIQDVATNTPELH